MHILRKSSTGINLALYLLIASFTICSLLLSGCGNGNKKEESADTQTTASGEKTEEYDGPVPVIFIHGMIGSRLVAESDSRELWPPAVSDLISEMGRLSINPVHGDPEAIFTPDLIRNHGGTSVYGEFLEYLCNYGDYVEYEIKDNPGRRTETGAYLNQKPTPNLFVFSYDWRLTIEDTIANLAEYMKVIKKYHPESKVNIVTHSLGGVVARRYILDHPDEVNKLVTIAAPFLGSVKPLYQMINGKITGPTSYLSMEAFEGFVQETLSYYYDIVRDMLSFYPGLHVLMASRSYYALGGPPMAMDTVMEDIWEEGTALSKELSFVEVMGPGGLVDTLFPEPSYNGKTPAKTNLDFHSYQNNGNYQDDWSNDTTGVKYYHLYGVRHEPDTPLSLIGTEVELALRLRQYAFNDYGPGDGTVPLLSAERIGNGKNLNAPGAELYKFTEGPDELLEHAGLMRNPNVMVKVLEILKDKKEDPEPVEKQWRLETVDYPNPQGEVIPWSDSFGSHTLTITATQNSIKHVIETFKGGEVTGKLEITVQYNIPSTLTPDEQYSFTADWTMKAEGEPRYNAAGIEFRRGDFAGTIKRISLDQNPNGSMVFDWKVTGIADNENRQSFDLTTNLKSTTTDYGLIKYIYAYP